MIDIKLLREEKERVRKAIATKNADPNIVDEFLQADEEWRKLTATLDVKRAEQKKLSGQRDIEGGKRIKEEVKTLEEEIALAEKSRAEIWLKIPNLPSEDTPIGKDESANKILRVVGEPRKFDFQPKDHLEIGEKLGLINVKKAAEISGTRFSYIFGDAVRLEFALIQYALEILTNQSILRSIAEGVEPGYSDAIFLPSLPPVMIRPEVFRKMARLEPSEDKYRLADDNLYLVGSSEHTLGPLHMEEALEEAKLPIRYVGFSTCFRREAGSYGRDTRGILRVHQFDKLEMESFVLPEYGRIEQDFFVAVQEYLMWSLGLPYRVVICSTGDQGDPDYRHIDLETWMPGQETYRETHSADYMTDYQARRLNTKVRRTDGKLEFVHMNDATVLAMGRILIAILENYQTADGRVTVPEILRKYVGKDSLP